MTPYIEAKKAEVRELLKGRGHKESWHSTDRVMDIDAVEDFCEELIDTLLDEIEGRVVPEKREESHESHSAECQVLTETGYESEHRDCMGALDDSAVGFNACSEKVKAAFQHLRTGVETEEVMPSCRGCGAIDGEPCDTRFHADHD